MTSFINDKFRGMVHMPSFGFTSTSASPVEIVPTGRSCLLTALSVVVTTGAGTGSVVIEDKAGGDMWAFQVPASGTFTFTISFPHPIYSNNGMQTNPIGTITSVGISVGYIDLDSGII